MTGRFQTVRNGPAQKVNTVSKCYLQAVFTILGFLGWGVGGGGSGDDERSEASGARAEPGFTC